VPDNATHEIGSHLIEQFLITAPDETFNDTLETHFSERLLAMAKHPVANYVLQSLITNLRTPEQVIEHVENYFSYIN